MQNGNTWELPFDSPAELELHSEFGSLTLVPVEPDQVPRLELSRGSIEHIEVHVEKVGETVRLAWEAGRFSRPGVSWETLESLVEIKIDAPAVATRDALKMAQTQSVQIDLGILSRRTAAAQAGLDYDAEVEQGAAAKMTHEMPKPTAETTT